MTVKMDNVLTHETAKGMFFKWKDAHRAYLFFDSTSPKGSFIRVNDGQNKIFGRVFGESVNKIRNYLGDTLPGFSTEPD